ncbi:MAG: Hsp70 family protein [Nitrospirae bacterium]|nr:Hsp70 family protein [Nitrospirota bacterium]
MNQSRYIIGIDLGTTNCVVSYIDNTSSDKVPKILPIPQITQAGVVGNKDTLPSYIYIPTESELTQGGLSLPWDEQVKYVTGIYAMERGAQVPNRLISSSKSWLCHPNIDKTKPILPWNAADDSIKISPVYAASALLKHIKMAWNSQFPDNLLEVQDVFITVPASFDTVARELTVTAAKVAGIIDHILLEEPTSAFYAWLASIGDSWRNNAVLGDIIIVIDIGGGTSDFSLIEVAQEKGDLILNRIAIGEHLLLGGDNMDITLAYALNAKFIKKGIKLTSSQMLELIHNCRSAKEKLLSNPEIKSLPVTVLGTGRSVIGGSIQSTLEYSEIEEIILNGFFPNCNIGDMPAEKSASGFKELGLHYAGDPAITKHISKFLTRHAAPNTKFIRPTKVLFNGGVTKSKAICNRIMEILNSWLTPEIAALIIGNDPDKAVAIGASYYGLVKNGQGIRIRGGTARTYYIGIETSMPAVPGMTPPIKALTVASFGMEEGTDIKIKGQQFGLVVGENAVFRFLSSTVRKADTTGTILEDWLDEEITEHDPLEVTLTAENITSGTIVPVTLHSFLTEIGILELWAESIDGKYKWKLEFNLRKE